MMPRKAYPSTGLLSPVFGFKKEIVIRQICRWMTAMLTLALLGACSVLPSGHHPKKQVSSASRWYPWNFLGLKREAPPPKAAPLSGVGTIRSVSGDGSYVIVELASGTLVRTGESLLVTSPDHPLSRLKVAEVQPPCFAAEIEEGAVNPGDIVKR
jgi:hypothetical protein